MEDAERPWLDAKGVPPAVLVEIERRSGVVETLDYQSVDWWQHSRLHSLDVVRYRFVSIGKPCHSLRSHSL